MTAPASQLRASRRTLPKAGYGAADRVDAAGVTAQPAIEWERPGPALPLLDELGHQVGEDGDRCSHGGSGDPKELLPMCIAQQEQRGRPNWPTSFRHVTLIRAGCPRHSRPVASWRR